MVSILDAARDLFAERGPASVSMRDVAELAHVNHALIYRHFGTKEALLRQVLHREALAFSSASEDAENPGEAVRALFDENVRRQPFIRILAFSLLSGTDLEDLYSERGALSSLLKRVEQESPSSTSALPDSIDPRLAVAAVSAFTKGWLLFEPWVLHAVDADDANREDLREQVATLLTHIVSLANAAQKPGKPRLGQ